MRKTLPIILALTLVLAMAAPVLADNPGGGNTSVSYTVADSYTISIPTAVNITGATATQEVKVNANSVIPADKSLQFVISAAENSTEGSSFRMKNSLDPDVFLVYSIRHAEVPVVLGNAFLTATAAEAYTGKSITLTYTPGTAESAGTYSDTLTFTVSLI